MAHIEKHLTIDAPIGEVYALARDPRRWNTWWPNLSASKLVRGDGGAGSVVEHTYRILGIPIGVTTRVLEDGRDGDTARWKGAIDGPLDGEQTWSYRSVAEGAETEVTAEVDYTVPGILGKVADDLVVERLQERAIEHTLANLKLLCEASGGASGGW